MKSDFSLQPSPGNIGPGTIFAVQQGKQEKEYFVYEIIQANRYACLKVRKFNGTVPKDALPGIIQGDRIISYGIPTEISSGQIKRITLQLEPVKVERVISSQKHFMIKNRVPSTLRRTLTVSTAEYRPAASKDKTPHSSIPNAEKYSVTDRIIPGSSGICPVCRSRIYSRQYNVPAYDPSGNFHAYYAAMLFHCPQCHNHFISEKDFHELVSRVSTSSSRSWFRPQNMTKRYDNTTHAYLYAPVATDISLFRNVPPRTEKKPAGHNRTGSDDHSALNDSSFLADMGYSTSLSTSDRRKILDNAIRKYGRRKTSDHIRFLIRMREAQSGGAARYANAISIWQEDLNYIARL